MSRFRKGAYTNIADGTAVPSGNGVGTLLSTLPGRAREARYFSTRVTIVASGAFSTNITAYTRDADDVWALCGIAGGDINGGVAFAGGAGTHVFELGGEFLGVNEELYYRSSDNTGITTLTVAIAAYIED